MLLRLDIVCLPYVTIEEWNVEITGVLWISRVDYLIEEIKVSIFSFLLRLAA